jgi:hypothetical protein
MKERAAIITRTNPGLHRPILINNFKRVQFLGFASDSAGSNPREESQNQNTQKEQVSHLTPPPLY